MLVQNGLLTRQDVAALFHITPQSVTLWVKLKKLPRPLRIGRRLLWRHETLEKLLGKIER
jgi:hypothetical protein